MNASFIFGGKSHSISKEPYKFILDTKKISNVTPIMRLLRSRNIKDQFCTQCLPKALLPVKNRKDSTDYISTSTFFKLQEHIENQRKIITKLTKDVSHLKLQMKSQQLKHINSPTKKSQFPICNQHEHPNYKITCVSTSNVKKLSICSKYNPSKINIEFQSPSIMRIPESEKSSKIIRNALKRKAKNNLLLKSLVKESNKHYYSLLRAGRDNSIPAINEYDQQKDYSLIESNKNDTLEEPRTALPKRRVIYIRTKQLEELDDK